MGVKLGLSQYRKNTDGAFKNRVLWKISGQKREGVTGGQRKLYDVKLLYSPPNIIIVVKSRRMIYVGHVIGKPESSCLEDICKMAVKY